MFTRNVLSKPPLHVINAPKETFCAGKPTNRREGLRIACGVAADAGNGFMKALCKLIDRQKDGRNRSDRCLSHFDNPIARLGSSSSYAGGLLGIDLGDTEARPLECEITMSKRTASCWAAKASNQLRRTQLAGN